MSKLQTLLTIPNKSLLLRSCLRSVTLSKEAVSLEKALDAAYGWLCGAQDATPDDGVAAWYDLLRGWCASYPETTGYIIPTFLTYSNAMCEPDARIRALRMADWEIDVQLPTGAVRSGTMTSKVAPAVFNTGQVLFGWVAAYSATGDDRYAKAAEKAASWLIQEQDEDGAWRRNLSLMVKSRVHSYNVRTAWGLAWAGHVFQEPRWIRAALKNCDWTLKQQRENGWFSNNAFSDEEAPLLHTIGYVLEGLVGVGELFQRQDYLEAALRGLSPLVEIYQRHGKLPGRLQASLKSRVSWRCLTGEAQISLVLHRLSKHFEKKTRLFRMVSRAIVEDIARTQDLQNPFPEIIGGIAGSSPIWGGYCPFTYLNWAAKFYMDALLLGLFEQDVVYQPAA